MAVEVEVEGAVERGGGGKRGAGKETHLAYHGEDGGERVGWGWGEGDVEDGGGVEEAVDGVEVVGGAGFVPVYGGAGVEGVGFGHGGGGWDGEMVVVVVRIEGQSRPF